VSWLNIVCAAVIILGGLAIGLWVTERPHRSKHHRPIHVQQPDDPTLILDPRFRDF
jgi:hypothetical protein